MKRVKQCLFFFLICFVENYDHITSTTAESAITLHVDDAIAGKIDDFNEAINICDQLFKQ